MSEKKNLLEINGFVDLVKMLDEELLSENPDVIVQKHSLQEQFIEVIRDGEVFEAHQELLSKREIEIQESFSEFGKKTRGRRRRIYKPVIKSISPPDIIGGSAQQITFSGENFGNSQIDVLYNFGGSSATSTANPENQGTTASTFVPADVYNNSIGTNIDISVVANGFTSNSVQSNIVAVIKPSPKLTSISGDIQNGVATTLTIVGFNFGSGAPGHPAIVQFNIGGSITNQNAATTNNFEVTVVIPAAVYSQSVGTVVNIKVFENDGAIPVSSSNSINKTIIS